MAGLNSFEDFTKARAQRLAEEEAQKQTEAREETARSFKDLLAEYGVTKVSELDEEKRGEFFSRLEGTDLNESLSLIEEGTRSFFGKINKKGDIQAVYMHYDGYPENMLPLIKKGYSGSKRKNIDVVIQNGAGSGLAADPKKINYYNDDMEPMAGNAGYIRDFIGDAKQSWAEFIYLYDERDGKWYMADTYEDNDLKPAFETVETTRFEKFVFEATGSFPIEYKRDAKKVVTQYNHLFGKKYTSLVDGGNMQLGAIKVIFQAAMEDANFSREGNAIAKNIKGSLSPIITKPSGLGNIEVKVSSDRIKVALYNEASRISNAAGWGGQGIVEGTALYLDSIGEKTMAAKLIADFHAQFESKEVLEARILEGNEFGAARAKAIADGEDEFEVDGETYKVTGVDKEDKENAEEFANEGKAKKPTIEVDAAFAREASDAFRDAFSKIGKMTSTNTFEFKNTDDAEDFAEYLMDYGDVPEEEITGWNFDESFVNEWGSSDQSIMNQQIHKDAGSPKKMPSPFDRKLRDAAENAVDWHWDDWPEYKRDRDGLIDDAVRGYLRSYFRKDFEMMVKMFEPMESAAVEVSEGLNKSDVQYQLRIAHSGNTPPKVVKLNKKKLEVRYPYRVNPDYVIDQVKMLYPEVELTHVKWSSIMSGGGVHSFDIKESVVTEAKYDKKKLLKLIKNHDDAEILVNGKWYIIYNPDNGNDENTEMWAADDYIYALDPDGEEFEIKYKDIEQFKESVVTEAEVKSDDDFKEYAFAVLQKAFGDKFDEEKAQEIVDGLISKHNGDYGAMVGALQSSLG